MSRLVAKSAASALLALKWPARKITSWRLPSSFVESCDAVQEAGSCGDLSAGVTSRSAAAPVPACSSVRTALGRVGEEVVAGHERRARGDDAARLRVGVDQAGDLGRRLDEAADGEPGDREGARPQRDLRPGAVGVLAEHEVVAQARLRGGVAPDGRHVAGLLAEQALVGVAEERDRVVAARDDDVAEPGFARPVGVDDALDLLGDEVLRERAGGVLPPPAASARRRGRRRRRRRRRRRSRAWPERGRACRERAAAGQRRA